MGNCRRMCGWTVLALSSCAALGGVHRTVVAQATPGAPTVAGRVLTVNGPIDPAEVGHALMHEHVFIDFNLPDSEPARWRDAGRTPPTAATAVGVYNRPLTMGLLDRVLFGHPNRDNWLLADEETAVRELGHFTRQGGGTVVDVTSQGLGRDPLALRRVANATGLHVVMGSSWYRKSWHPPDMAQRSIESLTDEIVRDVRVGVGDTGVRAGIIGEVGTQGDPLTPDEIKVIRASGRASRLTGAAVTLHTTARLREQPTVLDLLAEEGADLTRVIVGHSNELAVDLPFMTELLDRGVYIQFDLLGRNPTVRRRVSDTDVAHGIVDLVEKGYVDRILLSQDVCTKVQLKSYGGTGFSFIHEQFIPYLEALGVTTEQIGAILVSNPRRVLTLEAPRG